MESEVNYTGTVDDATVMSAIDAIIAREGDSDALYPGVLISDAIARELPALLGPGVGSILERRLRDYVIHIGYGGLRALADDLVTIRALEIAAAPELVALRPLREGYVLVARYWACPGEQLRDVGARSEISASAAVRFRHDMQVLAQHGKLHPYAGRGYDGWLVGERSGTIALAAWNALRPLSDHERDEVLEGCERLLARLVRRP